MPSDNKMVLTRAGIIAFASARTNGPMVNLVGIRLGAGVNYEPSSLDTALHGALLHPMSGYIPLSNYYLSMNTDGKQVCNFSFVLDDSIGNFQFGEIGIYQATGEMAGLYSYPQLQSKIKSTAQSAGNTIEVILRLVLDDSTEPVIEFQTFTGTVANRAELSSLDMLLPPSAAAANNFRIDGQDEFGRGIIVEKATDAQWYSPNFDLLRLANGVVDNASPYSLKSSELGSLLTIGGIVNGRYVMYVLDGPHAGRVRALTPMPQWQPNTYYEENQYIRNAAGTSQFRVVEPGVSGGSPPTWPANSSNLSVVDNEILWLEDGSVSIDVLNWVGSTGTPLAIGTTFKIMQATSVSGLDSMIATYHLARRGITFFNYHH